MRVRLGRWWEDAIERGDPRFSIHVGRFFGRLSTHTAWEVKQFSIFPPPSPFRGLALCISVRTDRIGRVFSPLGDLFRRKPLPNPRLLTRLFLPRDYTAPQKVDRASFSQFLFILATSPSGQEREKRIVFVWCSGQSIDGGRTDRQLPY